MKKYVVPFLVTFFSLAGLWLYLARTPPEGLGPGYSLSEKISRQAEKNEYFNGGDHEAQASSRVDFLVRELESSANKNVDVEERVQMARDLNAAYRSSRSELMQNKVSEALTQALRREKDVKVSRALALAHSRLPYDAYTLPNLRAAYERKVIDFDDYYGELAHLYSGAPEKVRGEVIKEISVSHNRYAVDIVAGSLVHDENIQLSKEEVSDFRNLLESNEPIFSGSAQAFGYFDAILYVNWLIALSRLQKEGGGISMEKFLGNKLLDPATDSRASIAFLITGYAKNMDTSQRTALQWDAVQARARDLIEQNPDSPSLQYVLRDMEP